MLPLAGQAQYFGRNKVLWQHFDFKVEETEHFRIYYYPAGSPIGQQVARYAERWYERYAQVFDHQFQEKKDLIIYQDPAEFRQTVVTPGLIGQGIGGFTESLQSRVVLPLTGVNADNNHVIGHELVHVFQFDIADQLRRKGVRADEQRLPLWMTEGLAEYLSQGRDDPTTALWMRDAVLHDKLPEPGKIFSRNTMSPYQYGQAVWAYVGGRWGDRAVVRLYTQALVSGFEDSAKRVLKVASSDAFYKDFNGAMKAAYDPVLQDRLAANEVAEPLLNEATTGARVNIAPSLSPDGRQVAFLSTRELALELYLADARTGKIVRRLIKAEANPHFDSLSFLDSSVAWSPDGGRLAFTAFAEGERRIEIYDVGSHKIERHVAAPRGLRGIRDPAWSPDGRELAFSAIVNGASSLYLLDIQSGDVTRLTEGGYTAIQPVFSPDGRRLVFVTDRNSGTSLETLHFGALGLATLDLDTRLVSDLPIFSRGKLIDPHFSSDGQSIYFIGEPDGVPDVFRYDLQSRRVERITALKTGVAGLTSISPALTVAARTGEVAFSVLEDGDWSVYRLRGTGPAPAQTYTPTASAGILPPASPKAGDQLVQTYLSDPAMGLPPDDAEYATQDYDSRMTLANVGPATVGVTSTTDTSWGGIGGAISIYFTDPLGTRQLGLTVLGGTSGGGLNFSDTLGAEATYLNQEHRLQWGARLSRIPFLSGSSYVTQEPVDVNGTTVPADVVNQVLDVVNVSEASVIAQYPFSLNQRIEGSVGVSVVDFKRELQRLVYPVGYPPMYTDAGLPSPESLHLRNASLAYVRDTSRFDFISPVRGMRFRLESDWTTGDLNYRTMLLDYRRYFFLRPLSFALRALHIARYGSGAADPRLPAYDLGYNLVRGYEPGSFDLSECALDISVTQCPVLDRVVGSRLAVLNFELRVPVLGAQGYGLFDFPAAPTEAVLFVDAGAAWDPGETVVWKFERDTAEHVPVVSAGIAARTVLLGALPLEFYYAYPFQRPKKDWVFGVRIGIGW